MNSDTSSPWIPSTTAARWRAVGGAVGVVGLVTVGIHRFLAHGEIHVGGILISHSMIDLGVYRAGARALLDGVNPYRNHIGSPGDLPYTYTPFSTIALVPLGWLPRNPSEVLSSVVSVVMLMTGLLVVVRRLFGRLWSIETIWRVVAALTLLISFSEPVRETFGFGQVNIVLMAMVLIDLVALEGRRGSGVLVGIAAGIKLIPLIFVLYLLATRRFRAAAIASASAAGTVVLGWLVMPGASATYFFHLMFDAHRVGGVGYVGDQSINGLLTRLGDAPVVAKPYWVIAAVATLLLGIWVAKRVFERYGEPAGVAVAALTGLLVSPISWSHHWVWWIVGVLVLAQRAWLTRSASLAACAAACTVPFFVAPFWIMAHPSRAKVQSTWFRQVVGDTYVLTGLIVLAVLAVAIWTRPPISPRSVSADSRLAEPVPIGHGADRGICSRHGVELRRLRRSSRRARSVA